MPNWAELTHGPRQNGRHFPDDIFKWIFLNENVWISINISLKFVPRGPINNIITLVQVMAWRRPGDKPLSEPMMVRSPTHICVTRPQWVDNEPTEPCSVLHYLTNQMCCYQIWKDLIYKWSFYLFDGNNANVEYLITVGIGQVMLHHVMMTSSNGKNFPVIGP